MSMTGSTNGKSFLPKFFFSPFNYPLIITRRYEDTDEICRNIFRFVQRIKDFRIKLKLITVEIISLRIMV